MNRRYIFIGERPSKLAESRKVSWEDGKLAAKQLFDALRFCGIDPNECKFVNLFPKSDRSKYDEAYMQNNLEMVKWAMLAPDVTVVGLGQIVQTQLDKAGIQHTKLVHPAARGAIRKKERYIEHVWEVLLGAETA